MTHPLEFGSLVKVLKLLKVVKVKLEYRYKDGEVAPRLGHKSQLALAIVH